MAKLLTSLFIFNLISIQLTFATMCGEERYLDSLIPGKKTSGRVSCSENEDRVRELFQKGAGVSLILGDFFSKEDVNYGGLNYEGLHYRDVNYKGWIPSYFSEVSFLEKEGFFYYRRSESISSCYNYALRNCGNRSHPNHDNRVTSIIEELEALFSNITIEDIIKKYFECVEKPIDGDFVLYRTTKPLMVCGQIVTYPHAGVYRISPSETPLVESKWGNFGDIYITAPFFISPLYGNEITYYRLKEE